MKLLYILAFSLLLILSSSCKKDDDAPTCPFTVAGVTGSYTLTSMLYRTTPNGSDTQIIGSLPACKRDDVLTLNANGLYFIQDVGVTCGGGGSIAGSWTITSNTISFEGDVYNFGSWDCTSLIIYKDNRVTAGDRTAWIYTKQ